MYTCPLCQTPLITQEHGFACQQRHTFDRAKEGYVNLLPVQHKGSRDPGDSPEMLLARRQFLDEDHYLPLRNAVVNQLQAALAEHNAPTILDLGCGEGYYTSGLTQISKNIYGLDVSKHAVKWAAKRYRAIQFCVASGYRLPFADNSLDAITRIYAPSKTEELARSLRTGGVLLTVVPGPRHLYQFKEMIYQEVQLHSDKPEELPGFEMISQKQLSYPLNLGPQSATQLLQMTPFAWRASPEVWQKIAQSDQLACDVDFLITLWRKI